MYPKNCKLIHLFSHLLCNYCRGIWRWTNRVSSISLNRMCPCWDTNICYHCRDRDIIFEVQRWSRLVLLLIVINMFVKMFLWHVKLNGEELLAPCPTPELEDHCDSSWFLLPSKYFLGNQIKKNELGGACGTHGVEERFMQDFAGENWWEWNYLEDLCIDGRIILKWVLKQSGVEIWTQLIMLRTGASGGLLWKQ